MNRQGIPKGRTIVRGEPLQPGDYHLVIHIWITDDSGRFLIQKRADHLSLYPGIWAATSGSALAGETSEKAAVRELKEELGITAALGEMNKLCRIIRSDNLVDLWLIKRNIDLG